MWVLKPPGAGALQQFLALANSSKGLAAVELIKNILKHPSLFLFGEVLEHPNIKAVRCVVALFRMVFVAVHCRS